MIRGLRCLILLLVFLLTATPAYSGQAESLFNQGMQAFNTQDYQSALTLFLQARERGLTNKRLPYNLGVTYYKLTNYPSAYEELQQAATDSELADVAQFNLGLTAYKLGNKPLAIEHFQTSLALATTTQQRQLSLHTLQRLGVKSDVSQSDLTKFLIKFSVGNNDNVGLQIEDDVTDQSELDDDFVSLYANIASTFMGQWTLEGGLYGINYSSLEEYKYSEYSVGLSYPKNDTSAIKITLWFVSNHFGDDKFQGNSNLRMQRFINLSKYHGIGASFRFSQIVSKNDSYDYLQGQVRTLSLYTKSNFSRQSLKFRFSAEDNNREDQISGGLFTSYSPTRQLIGFTHSVHVSTNIFFDWGLQYRRSKYDEENDIDFLTSKARIDNRRRGTARLMYRINKDWWISSDFETINNQSNIDEYNYKANKYLLNIIYQ